MTSMTSESLHRHMPEPVRLLIHENGTVWDHNPVLTTATILQNGNGACVIGYFPTEPDDLPKGIDNELTFAHVLNVPVSEEIWPGEAVDLFPQQFFAKSPHTGMFVHQGRVFEHMRCEILRLCSGKYSAKDFMEDELSFYCEFEGAYPANFCDRCEDEDEPLLDYHLDW